MTNEQAAQVLRDLKECQRLRTARWDGKDVTKLLILTLEHALVQEES